MKISIVLPSVYGKASIQKKFAYAPGPLADLLVKGLIRRGHDVTFFVPKGSPFSFPTINESHPILETELQQRKMSVDTLMREYPANFTRINQVIQNDLINQAFAQAKKRKTDLIHFFCQQNYPAFYLAEAYKIPTLFTLHDPIPKITDSGSWARPGIFFPKMNFVTVSKNQQKSNAQLHYVGAIHNAIDTKKYELGHSKEDYLAWIGRPTPYKGPDIAVRVAHKAGRILKLAGPRPFPSQMAFWKKTISPSIQKKRAFFLGYLQGKEKNQFLKKAAALLFPITWNEPFGIVMIEAMACGTPVIAFDQGAVREVIVHGKTGFIVKKEREMVAAVKRIGTINPQDCRDHVEKKFSPEKMVSDYEKIYQKVIR
jgi:glycosyltransferase involved in cell wall biosynthesis